MHTYRISKFQVFLHFLLRQPPSLFITSIISSIVIFQILPVLIGKNNLKSFYPAGMKIILILAVKWMYQDKSYFPIKDFLLLSSPAIQIISVCHI